MISCRRILHNFVESSNFADIFYQCLLSLPSRGAWVEMTRATSTKKDSCMPLLLWETTYGYLSLRLRCLRTRFMLQ